MKRHFAQGARELARSAARMLGWRPDDFWQATPAELATILAADPEDGAQAVSRRDMQILMERDPDGR